MITHTYRVVRPVVPEDLEKARSAEAFWGSQAERCRDLGRSYRVLRLVCFALAGLLMGSGATTWIQVQGTYAMPWIVGSGVLIWIGVLAGELQTRAMVSENARLSLAIAAMEAVSTIEDHLERHPVSEICSGKVLVECVGCGTRDHVEIGACVQGPRSQLSVDKGVTDEMFPTRRYLAAPVRRIWRRRTREELGLRGRGDAWICVECLRALLDVPEEIH